MPRITDFCSFVYIFGCKLSLVTLCDSDFGITPVDDVAIGITCAAFCFQIAHIHSPVLGTCFVSRSLFWRDYVYLEQMFLSKRCYYYYYYYYYILRQEVYACSFIHSFAINTLDLSSLTTFTLCTHFTL